MVHADGLIADGRNGGRRVGARNKRARDGNKVKANGAGGAVVIGSVGGHVAVRARAGGRILELAHDSEGEVIVGIDSRHPGEAVSLRLII